MKRISAITFFAMAGLIMLGSALARAQEVRAKVPFDFIVRDQVLPAGTYRIFLERSPNSNSFLRIENEDRNTMAVSIASADGNGSLNDSKLVFTNYGDQYFLHEVLCPAASITVELPTSKLEGWAGTREVQLQNSGRAVDALK
jgi:hypothetical protein